MRRGSKADEIITMAFMVFAVIAGGCLLFINNRLYFYILGGIAVAIRVIQYILRFFK
ncbi:MAG: hypothetical protein PHG27_07295 [Massilibacteroides sp.]|nr:hypothetical protein [Massilibacteroides sp.]MDD4115384.1 hypothetical protein [Massilibacteroides sp.]